MRSCDGCTLCCDLLEITALEKPRSQMCRHCDGSGCGIYEERPEVCQKFACMWLISEDIPDYMKPNQASVLLMPSDDGSMMLAYTDAPKNKLSGEAMNFLRIASTRYPTAVVDRLDI